MRSWINHLSKKDRYLHKVAQQTVGFFLLILGKLLRYPSGC